MDAGEWIVVIIAAFSVLCAVLYIIGRFGRGYAQKRDLSFQTRFAKKRVMVAYENALTQMELRFHINKLVLAKGDGKEMGIPLSCIAQVICRKEESENGFSFQVQFRPEDGRLDMLTIQSTEDLEELFRKILPEHKVHKAAEKEGNDREGC